MLNGFLSVDPDKLTLIRSFGGSKYQILTKILLPANIPVLMNVLKVNIGLCLIGVIIGGINFEDLKWVITPASGDVAECAIRYGTFLQSIVNFLLIALVVFTMVKLINLTHRKKAEEAPTTPPAPPEDVVLLREIRDLLKK